MMKPLCIICKARRTIYWREVNNYALWKCKKCKALFVHPFPSDEDIRNFYGEKYFCAGSQYSGYGYENYEERNYNWTPERISYYEKIEKKLLAHVSKDDRLLDVGCATGAFLIFLRDRGWKNLYGIEFSQYAAAVGRKYDLNIIDGRIEDAKYPNDYFDVVFSLFVIEHLKDPHAFMQGIYRVIKPKGLFYCGTNDFGAPRAKLINLMSLFGHQLFIEIKPPEHLIMFSKCTLETLAKLHGFKMLEVFDINGIYFSDLKFKNTLLRKIKPLFDPVFKHIPGDDEFMMVLQKS